MAILTDLLIGFNRCNLLFDRYADFIYNFAFRRTGNWDAAEEIVSAVFLEAEGGHVIGLVTGERHRAVFGQLEIM